MVSSTLKVFQLNRYVFLYVGTTLSFVISNLAMRFDISLKVLLEHLTMSTLIFEFVFVERVNQTFLIFLSHRVTRIDLVLDMLYFEITVELDWSALLLCFY